MPDSNQPLKASKIETAKRLKGIKDIVVSPKEYEMIRGKIVDSNEVEAIERAIKGLSQEDEFALMCQMMGTTTHLVRLEQSPIIKGDYIAPDFMARFQPGLTLFGYQNTASAGFRCLIEVKSTNTWKVGIGGSILQRRRNFAKEFGLPLLFAVRFLRFGRNAVWAVIEDADQTKTKLNITTDTLNSSIRYVLWDEYYYLLPNDMQFVYVYDSASLNTGVGHKEYGSLQEFHIITAGKVVILKDFDACIYAGFFEAFELQTVDTKTQGSTTLDVVQPEVHLCSIADMLYRFNRLVQDEAGQTIFDPSRILAMADTDEQKVLITRGNIEAFAEFLIRNELIFVMGVGERDKVFDKWLQYGGQR